MTGLSLATKGVAAPGNHAWAFVTKGYLAMTQVFEKESIVGVSQLAKKHYVGEVGVPLLINCRQDLSLATGTKFVVKKPNGTIVEWPAVPYTIGGVCFYMRYFSTALDFDQEGEYEVQAYAMIGNWRGLGETFQFLIYKAFA